MLTIQLNQLQFFAYHGLYEEERILGTQYEVDVSIRYAAPKTVVRSLSETIDYTVIYEMLFQRMQIPTPLLETIATEFAHAVLERFPLADEIVFSIKKMNPPITAMIGNVGVKFELKRSSL